MRASPSPPSPTQTWQAGQDAAAAAVPEDDVDREDADVRRKAPAQSNQLPPCPPMPRSPLSLLQCHTVTHAKRPSVAVECTVVTHSEVEFAGPFVYAAAESDAAATAGKAAPAKPSVPSAAPVIRRCPTGKHLGPHRAAPQSCPTSTHAEHGQKCVHAEQPARRQYPLTLTITHPIV